MNTDLVKQLVKLRIQDDSMASVFGVSATLIESLTEFQLAGLPEATILTIVESWVALKSKGLSDKEIFSSIEAHRSIIGASSLPNPLTLENYIIYRVALEHSAGAPIDPLFIKRAIEIVKNKLIIKPKPKPGDHNVLPPIPFSLALPDVTQCEPVRVFELGNYMGFVVKNPPSVGEGQGVGAGLIEYLYALVIVDQSSSHMPLLIVTAERSGPGLRAAVENATGHGQTTDPFLCVFEGSGAHRNLGAISGLDNIECFMIQALRVAQKYVETQKSRVETREEFDAWSRQDDVRSSF